MKGRLAYSEYGWFAIVSAGSIDKLENGDMVRVFENCKNTASVLTSIHFDEQKGSWYFKDLPIKPSNRLCVERVGRCNNRIAAPQRNLGPRGF